MMPKKLNRKKGFGMPLNFLKNDGNTKTNNKKTKLLTLASFKELVRIHLLLRYKAKAQGLYDFRTGFSEIRRPELGREILLRLLY